MEAMFLTNDGNHLQYCTALQPLRPQFTIVAVRTSNVRVSAHRSSLKKLVSLENADYHSPSFRHVIVSTALTTRTVDSWVLNNGVLNPEGRWWRTVGEQNLLPEHTGGGSSYPLSVYTRVE